MEINQDFSIFKQEVPWYFNSYKSVKQVSGSIELTEKFKSTFPKLTEMIEKSRMTFVEISNVPYVLFAWNKTDGTVCGWLNNMARSSNIQLGNEHKLLVENIGGIEESFNQPEDSFSNNQNFMFVSSECFDGIGEHGNLYYLPLCQEEGLEPIDYSDYVTFAYEANGNLTLYNKQNGGLLLFSHDHCFDYVEFVEGQPEYTFHRFTNVSTFHEYVEELANQWLSEIAK